MMGVRGVFRTGEGEMLYFFCPGCKERHGVRVGTGLIGPRWNFNYDYDKPTLSPSINITWTNLTHNTDTYEENKYDEETHVCHSFIRDGNIEFLADCTHALAGQTVALLPVAEAEVLT